MKVAGVAGTRRLESAAIQAGTTGFQLMKTAAAGAAALLRERMERDRFRRLVFLAGRGNNGGDALATAALLAGEYRVAVHSAGALEALRGEAAEAAASLDPELRAAVRYTLEPEDLMPGDLVADGLLGIGFAGTLRPELAAWIRIVNDSRLPVVSLDVPSGLSADTGEGEEAVRAEMTVTFGYPKRGLFLGRGPSCAGRLRLVPLPLPEPEAAETETWEAFFDDDAFALMPRPAFDAFKNRQGRVLIAAGSPDYPGAAALAAHGALRAGAGLVTLASAERPAGMPAAVIFRPVSRPAELEKLLTPGIAVGAGCGWGNGPELRPMLSRILAADSPLVLDADALNQLSRSPELWKKRPNTVMTPHPGEAARLAGAFGVTNGGERRAFAAALAAKLGAVIVLKGAGTVVAAPDGRVSVNTSGSAALATAGSGDVLTGVIAALLAQGMTGWDAARLGVYLHGRAGERGGFGLIADELPELVAAERRRLIFRNR